MAQKSSQFFTMEGWLAKKLCGGVHVCGWVGSSAVEYCGGPDW